MLYVKLNLDTQISVVEDVLFVKIVNGVFSSHKEFLHTSLKIEFFFGILSLKFLIQHQTLKVSIVIIEEFVLEEEVLGVDGIEVEVLILLVLRVLEVINC